MLESGNLEFLMEAHTGLAAKIVEEAGTVYFHIESCMSQGFG